VAFKFFGILKGLQIQNESDRTKQLQLEVASGATTDTATTIQAAQTANRTVTLPNATDTLVGRATTDTLTNKSIDADTNTITNIENADIKAAAAIDATKIADGSVSNAEFQTLNGVSGTIVTTSEIQTLTSKTIDADANTITNIENADIKAAAAIALNKLAATTASRALVSDGSGFVSASATTSTEIGHVSGVTSAIQTQLNTNATNISNHISDPTAAHTASAIANVPSGNLSATDVQSALDELQTEIDAITPAAGANTELSNLANPTSISQHLLPSANNVRNLGSAVAQFLRTFAFAFESRNTAATKIQYMSADNSGVGNGGADAGVAFFDPSGATKLNIQTLNDATADANPTNDVRLLTGNKTAGTGNSGNVIAQTGTSSGGTRGKIQFKDGSEGTAAASWRSTDTSGSGAWVSPNYQLSSSSGTFSTTSGSYVDVTNLTVTITTTGRPVMVGLTHDQSANLGQFGAFESPPNSGAIGLLYKILRDASTVSEGLVNGQFDQAVGENHIYIPASSVVVFDVPSAGTYTYKMQVLSQAAGTGEVQVSYAKLYAVEL
jgi:hypothetical protein